MFTSAIAVVICITVRQLSIVRQEIVESTALHPSAAAESVVAMLGLQVYKS